MGTSGLLEQLPFTEFVQTLANLGKSGRITLARFAERGFVILRRGQIVGAASSSVRETLGSLLVGQGLLSESELMGALERQGQPAETRLLGRILVDEGILTEDQLGHVVRQQTRRVIGELMTWRYGFIEFEPCEVEGEDVVGDDLAELMLSDGISAESLILAGAVEIDHQGMASLEAPAEVPAASPPPKPRAEAPVETRTSRIPTRGRRRLWSPSPRRGPAPSRSWTPCPSRRKVLTSLPWIRANRCRRRRSASDSVDTAWSLATAPMPEQDEPEEPEAVVRMANLRDLMAELRSLEFTGEITSRIMEHSTRLLKRSVLFSVQGGHFCGLACYGAEPVDDEVVTAVRDLRIPVGEPSVLADAAAGQESYVGGLPDLPFNRRLIDCLGGDTPPEVVAVPLVVDSRVLMVLYGDSASGGQTVESKAELELLMLQAGLVMEKERLEALQELRARGKREPESGFGDFRASGGPRPGAHRPGRSRCAGPLCESCLGEGAGEGAGGPGGQQSAGGSSTRRWAGPRGGCLRDESGRGARGQHRPIQTEVTAPGIRPSSCPVPSAPGARAAM